MEEKVKETIRQRFENVNKNLLSLEMRVTELENAAKERIRPDGFLHLIGVEQDPQVLSMQFQIDQLKGKNDKLSTRNIELASSVDNLRGFQYGLKTKIQNLEKENEELCSQVGKLKDKEQKQLIDVYKLEQENKRLNAQVIGIRNSRNEFQKQVKALEEQSEKLRLERNYSISVSSDKDFEICSLKNKNERLKKQVNGVKEESVKLREDRDYQISNACDLASRLCAMTKENEELRKKLEYYEGKSSIFDKVTSISMDVKDDKCFMIIDSDSVTIKKYKVDSYSSISKNGIVLGFAADVSNVEENK